MWSTSTFKNAETAGEEPFKDIHAQPLPGFHHPTLPHLLKNDVSLSDDMGREPLVFSFVQYVCMNCGFTSMYVGDMDDITNLPKTKGWKKVT